MVFPALPFCARLAGVSNGITTRRWDTALVLFCALLILEVQVRFGLVP